VDEDADLAKAIKLSKEEEELRRRELEDANANALFDDTPAPTQPAVSQPTGWNQGYQQQPSVDWFGNVIDPQQQQNTGFGVPGQTTGYQNGFGYPGYQQNQQTGFQNPMTTGLVQPQQTAFNSNNPYSQQTQPNGLGAFGQQQPLQQQPLQQQDTLQPGSNNPWATSNSAQELRPLPTGSNNPFASGFTRPASQPNFKQPTLSTLSEQKPTTSFNPIANYQAPIQQTPQPQQQPSLQQQEPSKPLDPHRAHLNALLASGDGQDTFGNVGDTRIPAQHTAPGVFVNSAGAGAQRITQNATGSNPFFNQQFTGMPQSTGFGQNRMMPAATGPAGSYGSPFGQPNANPFGTQSQQQQNQNQGSLIDL
jgi:epsin